MQLNLPHLTYKTLTTFSPSRFSAVTGSNISHKIKMTTSRRTSVATEVINRASFKTYQKRKKKGQSIKIFHHQIQGTLTLF